MGVGVPLGPYRLVRRLATGGMAEIFLARQEGKDGFSRDLVVKRILPHLAADPEFRRMFQGEARLAARLSHPNVVHVYDYGSVVEDTGDETFYLAMELVRGVDLRGLIVRAAEAATRRGDPFAVPPHHAAKICSFVCEALAYAHELVVDGKRANIVHRDVTPSNVLLSFDGAVKLADFGIAKGVAGPDDATEHGVVKGKYSYLSPEQARGETLDRRSDLFNVGILLFESILGQPLFPHQDAKLAKRMSARGEIPDRLRLRRLPAPLADVAERALANRPGDRFPDALAMRAELETFVRRAPEPSDTVEIGRFVRALFPETVAEDRRAVRAAGTIAKSDIAHGVRARTAVLDDATGASFGASSADTESDPTLLSSGAISLGPELLDPTPAPLASVAPPLVPVLPPPPPAPAPFVPRVSRPADATPVVRRRRASNVGVWIAAGLIVLGASVAAGAMLLSGRDGPPREPPHDVLASAPTTLATARLHVTTQPPGAVIEIDGVPVGNGPSVQTVTAGVPHVVRALDVHGAELSRDELTLAEDEIRELTLSARPVSASLRVATTPSGASVRVDGELLGETPLSIDVAPVPHHVEVMLTGYDPVADDVRFAGPGEQAMLSFALRRQVLRSSTPDRHPPPTVARGSGTLRIATDPYSEVYEGSRHLGTTPLQIALPVGRHHLSLRSPGHETRSTDVEIRADEVTRLRLSL